MLAMEAPMSSRNCIVDPLRAVGRRSAFAVEPHVACQRAGFTLLEMIAVIGIIVILMGLLSPMVNRARKSARQADCRSNLRQFGIALTVYRADHAGKNPDWMSSLYPKYVDNKEAYVCKSDPSGGLGDIVSRDLCDRYLDPKGKGNTYERYKALTDRRNGIYANSYFYEFSAADCDWLPSTEIPTGMSKEDLVNTDGGGITWSEVKEFQLRFGDKANKGTYLAPAPYSASRMPIIRCWHHYTESRTTGYPDDDEDSVPDANLSYDQPLTLNVAYAGNVFTAPPWWEGRAEPGEK